MSSRPCMSRHRVKSSISNVSSRSGVRTASPPDPRRCASWDRPAPRPSARTLSARSSTVQQADLRAVVPEDVVEAGTITALNPASRRPRSISGWNRSRSSRRRAGSPRVVALIVDHETQDPFATPRTGTAEPGPLDALEVLTGRSDRSDVAPVDGQGRALDDRDGVHRRLRAPRGW